MNDTPLTDEQFILFENSSAGYVPINFARRLEREVNELKRKLQKAEETIDIMNQRWVEDNI